MKIPRFCLCAKVHKSVFSGFHELSTIFEIVLLYFTNIFKTALTIFYIELVGVVRHHISWAQCERLEDSVPGAI